MTDIKTLSVAQLRQAIDIKQQIESLQTQLDNITSGSASFKRPVGRPPGGRKLSAQAKARISAGMKAKWAFRLRKSLAEKPVKKRKMSAAGRAAIAAAQKARWAKAKAGE